MFGDKDTEIAYALANEFQKTVMQVFESFAFKLSQECELIEWDSELCRATFGCPNIDKNIAYQLRDDMSKYLQKHDYSPVCEIYDLKLGVFFVNTGMSSLDYKNIH